MLKNNSHHRPVVRELRALIEAARCELAPETPDGLLARMVALAGFEVAYVGLQGTTLNRIASADASMLTATELVDNTMRCVGASGLPTVVDAGVGFGNAINVRRTVEDLERAGAAGILLRDRQDSPADGRPPAPISPAEMAVKLRASCDARADTGLVILAGLDAGSKEPLDEVAHRARHYRGAGADLVHVGTLASRDRAIELSHALKGLPLACSLTAESDMEVAELASLRFRLAFFPHCGLLAAMPAIERTLNELARTGSVAQLRPRIASFREFTDIAGLPQVQQLETRYGVPEKHRMAL